MSDEPKLDLVIRIGGKLDRYLYANDSYGRLVRHHRDAREYFPTETDWDALHHLRSGDYNDVLDTLLEMCTALAEIRTAGSKLRVLEARMRLDAIRHDLRQAYYADAIGRLSAEAKAGRPRLYVVKG